MITVRGKIKESGKIEFDNLPSCITDYCACLVVTGEHCGQVALTIRDAEIESCNDTFYGCYKPDFDEYRVKIPTICCEPEPGEECSLCDCAAPGWITVIISDCQMCWLPENCSTCLVYGGSSYKIENVFFKGFEGIWQCKQAGRGPPIELPDVPLNCQWHYPHDKDYDSITYGKAWTFNPAYPNCNYTPTHPPWELKQFYLHVWRTPQNTVRVLAAVYLDTPGGYSLQMLISNSWPQPLYGQEFNPEPDTCVALSETTFEGRFCCMCDGQSYPWSTRSVCMSGKVAIIEEAL